MDQERFLKILSDLNLFRRVEGQNDYKFIKNSTNFLKKALGRNSASSKIFQTHLLLAVLSNFIYDRPFLKNLGNGTMPPLVWGLNVIKDSRELQETVGCFLVYFV